MTDQLTIGQSLTPEQVRNLPDGVKVGISQDRHHWLEFTVCQQIREFLHDAICVWAFSAVLVSLPSEPSPGEGYRWLVRDVDTIAPSDEYLNELTGLWEPTNLGFIGWSYKTSFAKMRRRIEPQAEPAPRVASEIEKVYLREAFHALLEKKQAALVDYIETNKGYAIGMGNIQDYVDNWNKVRDYARSIGAIE